jgi:hypothetical protein
MGMPVSRWLQHVVQHVRVEDFLASWQPDAAREVAIGQRGDRDHEVRESERTDVSQPSLEVECPDKAFWTSCGIGCEVERGAEWCEGHEVIQQWRREVARQAKVVTGLSRRHQLTIGLQDQRIGY